MGVSSGRGHLAFRRPQVGGNASLSLRGEGVLDSGGRVGGCMMAGGQAVR